MNTFSAFRFAARTLLHPRPAHFQCLSVYPRMQTRFQSQKATVRPRNKSIPFETVFLVDSDNVLVEMSLSRILETIDLKKEMVELVDTTPRPIVKILDRKLAFAKLKEAKAKKRDTARKNMLKEVQLTWTSAQSDIDHKLARVRTCLEFGARADIVFSNKAKTPAPTPAVMQKKLQDALDMMADVATECKPIEWRRNIAVIHLQGKVDASRSSTPESGETAAAEEAEDEAEAEAEAKAP
ncbi:hypothetical protein B0H15DRAFT_843390 [Mycena belliarum]|uniref:Translation initiation factor 3 N-terminal domain-containing protein n=1 Tax=Mycena belliarum TaxID=1033014 RepID=A0AAD6U1V5_9AGAR|nr:hypothetical protein B0H15DRAFT_843390 [Mycena belliae]